MPLMQDRSGRVWPPPRERSSGKAKGAGLADVAPQTVPILIFIAVAAAVAMKRYKQTLDWEKEVLRLTDGVGVDHVVEVGGAGTIGKSIVAARIGGKIGVIGVLTQGEGVNPMFLLMKTRSLSRRL